MPPRRLLGFRLAIHPAPAADDTLDVLGGAGPANGEESFFRLDRRDTRQRPDLGVRQLTACERLRQPRQRAERAGHSDALARRAPIEPDAPRQPLGAREEAGIPAAALVELADEVEQSRRGGVEMGGQLGDLVAETLELGGGGNGRFGHGRKSDTEFGKVLRGATIADRGSFESFSTDRTFEVSSPVCEKLERHFSCVGDL